MTAYDLYHYLNIILDGYMDSILIKEDPTELDKKNYEYIKNWKPKEPDYLVKDILTSIQLSFGEKNSEQK